MPLKIGLIDVDGHNFPSLPLMKLSTYHKGKDDTVEMCVPIEHYDIVYKSKVFTHTPDILYQPKADIIFEGGTGYEAPMEYHGGITTPTKMLNLPQEIEGIMPDSSLYPKYSEAYGFLTRGCPNCCSFCIVSHKEGCQSRKVADLSDFYAGQKVIKLLDPNLLACADREDLLFQLADSKALVDFTQGLDIRLIDKDLIGLLNTIKTKIIHFAWDNPNDDLIPKFKLFDKYSKLKNYRKRAVYVLVNYNSTHEQDLERVYRLKELGYNPFIMIYDKQNAPLITKHLQRWVNNRRIFRSCENFEDYTCESIKGVRKIEKKKSNNAVPEPMQGQMTCSEILPTAKSAQAPPGFFPVQDELLSPMTLGSLFDGIGGFMLAAETVGIKPLWASEIEPHCIAVTKLRFPHVPHLGDITQIDGGKIPPTDIISFGSPCQDLSICGKRKGISAERSGLFMEAVRIIKEMRAATNNRLPRYAIWENVPGALSSNDGEDFRIVLEELLNTALTEAGRSANAELLAQAARIGGDDNSKIKRITKTGFDRDARASSCRRQRPANVPKPPKWGNAGSIVGDNGENSYSISWRVLDSQYFGIPQRRKRIFLVASFGNRSSEEILFERESLSGDFKPGETKKQSITPDASGSPAVANIDGNNVGGLVYGKTFSIVENIIDRSEKSGGNGIGVKEDICYTLTTATPHAVVNCSLYNREAYVTYKENAVTGTLVAHLAQQGDDLVVNLGSQGDRIYCNAKKSVSLTSQSGGGGAKTGMYFLEDDYVKSKAVLSDALNTKDLLETIENIIDKEGLENLLRQGYELHINGVRRLTPLECERLQGYADGWTDIIMADKKGKPKPISDNARYKALGNSVAVPCVIFLLERLKKHCESNGGIYEPNGN